MITNSPTHFEKSEAAGKISIKTLQKVAKATPLDPEELMDWPQNLKSREITAFAPPFSPGFEL